MNKITFIYLAIILTAIFCQQCKKPDVVRKEIPVAITSKNHFTFNSDNSITISHSKPDSCGYFRIHNFRNHYWPKGYGIGFDNHKDFWFAGEFITDFHNHSSEDYFEREYNINLIQFYHLMYFQYIPRAGHRNFYFTITPQYDRVIGGGPELYLYSKEEFNFNKGDSMRYIVKGIHTGDTLAISVWYKNLVSGQLMVLYNKYKTIGQDVAFPRDIFLGSGSHGTYYHEEDIGRKGESFIGTITETIIGNNSISDKVAMQWIDYKKKPAQRIFDLKEIEPITEVSISVGWFNNDGTETNLRVSGQLRYWDDPRYVLSTKAESISCKLDSIYTDKDLTKDYLSFFCFPLSSLDEFHIKITLTSAEKTFDKAIDKRNLIIDLSPKYSERKKYGDILQENLKTTKKIKMYELNLVDLFNYESEKVSSKVTIRKIEIFGHCQFGDVLLTNKPVLINVR